MKKVVLGILVVVCLSSCCLFTYLFIKVRQIAYINNSFHSLYDDATALSPDGSLTAVDPADAHELLIKTRTETKVLKDVVEPYLFLAPLLQYVPEVGVYSTDAEHYVELMDAVSLLGEHFGPEVEAALRILQSESYNSKPTVPQLLMLLAQANPKLDDALPEIERAQQAYAEIENKSDLPSAIQHYIPLLDVYLPLADEGVELLKLLPELMSIDNTPRTYLLLVQNASVIQDIGIIQVERGAVTNVQIDSNFYESVVNNVSAEPLTENAWTNLLNHGAYHPDQPEFSSVTAQATSLFEQSFPEFGAISGVIVIDQHFISLLNDALGLSETGSVATVLERAHYQLSSELMTLDLGKLMDNMQEARTDNHMRLWLTLPHEEATFHGIFGED